MRRILFFIFIILLSCSCSRLETEIGDDTPEYRGTMTVTYDGREYVTGNVAVRAALSRDGSTVDLKLLKVKFVPQMPVRLDITVPDIPVLETGGNGTVSFAADGILPYTLGGYYEKYVVKDLSGTLDGNSIFFSLSFGDYPTVYDGSTVQ